MAEKNSQIPAQPTSPLALHISKWLAASAHLLLLLSAQGLCELLWLSIEASKVCLGPTLGCHGNGSAKGKHFHRVCDTTYQNKRHRMKLESGE